jgi:hypothetical protein
MRAALSCIIVAATVGLLPVAATAETRPAPRAAHHADTPPKHWIKTALKIAKCEQPSGRKGAWAGIAWKNEKNYSFLGGMGMTLRNWDDFKRKGQPERMSDATPMEQIWAAWRLYKWAEETYPGYGWTAWECSEMIGFRGFNRSNQWE